MYILENDKLAVHILPELGGKITSLYLKEKEFELAAPNRTGQYRLPGGVVQTGKKTDFGPDFSQYDASGLDDAFPNIDPGLVEWQGRKLYYPDHGEIWSHMMELQEIPEGIRLSYASAAFGYAYEKRMELKDSSLSLHYRIENRGGGEFPFLWTFHGLMRYEEDMRLLLPTDFEYYRNVLSHPVLGEEGRVYPARNDIYDFSRVPAPESKSMVKYYGEGKSREGACGLWYPSRGVRCMLRYDAQALPYLGVWITAGGYRGDCNCALEPSTGFYDGISRARENGSLKVIKPGEIFSFTLEICLENTGS